MPRARKPVQHWPADIPRTERIALDTGHGSFCLQRLAVEDDDEANDPRPVELRSCLLLHVRRGKAILARDGHEVLLLTGDAAILSPGCFTLTGLARPPATHYEHELVFFNHRVLADLLEGQEPLRQLALVNSAPDFGVFPLRNFGRLLVNVCHFHPGVEWPGNFRQVLRVTAQTSAWMLGFLKHHYLLPRGFEPISRERWDEDADKEQAAARLSPP